MLLCKVKSLVILTSLVSGKYYRKFLFLQHSVLKGASSHHLLPRGNNQGSVFLFRLPLTILESKDRKSSLTKGNLRTIMRNWGMRCIFSGQSSSLSLINKRDESANYSPELGGLLLGLSCWSLSTCSQQEEMFHLQRTD